MSYQDDLRKDIKSLFAEELDSEKDMTQEEWQSLKTSAKERAVFLHVFKNYDFTAIDSLLNNMDELANCEISRESVLAAWEDGKRKASHKKGSKDKGE